MLGEEASVSKMKKLSQALQSGADPDTLFRLAGAAGFRLYAASVTKLKGGRLALARRGGDRVLLAAGDAPFAGEEKDGLKTCAADYANARLLGELIEWCRPVLIGSETSFGAGDRLGVATAAHLRALEPYPVRPVVIQQSIREMTRTRRTPEDVYSDGVWGTLQAGFTRGVGADADHLKTADDLRSCARVGFTWFTVDPSDHIDESADSLDGDALKSAFEELFDSDAASREFLSRHANEFTLDGESFKLDEEAVMRVAAKYLRAVRHAVEMFGVARKEAGRFDFEFSIDETSTPTPVEAHRVIASELKRAGVELTALAPRFVGAFEKAVDYRGSPDEFDKNCRLHAAVAREQGPYKLSIHSGSDKFSVFPVVMRHTRGAFHEKTAGTSYLEALRVVARRDAALFREILDFSLGVFERDRASYHVTTDLKKVPRSEDLSDAELVSLLDRDDPRQVLHIGYGSVLTDEQEHFRERLLAVLVEHEEDYANVLIRHFRRHMDAFMSGLD